MTATELRRWIGQLDSARQALSTARLANNAAGVQGAYNSLYSALSMFDSNVRYENIQDLSQSLITEAENSRDLAQSAIESFERTAEEQGTKTGLRRLGYGVLGAVGGYGIYKGVTWYLEWKKQRGSR